jgi:hypothetical protein
MDPAVLVILAKSATEAKTISYSVLVQATIPGTDIEGGGRPRPFGAHKVGRPKRAHSRFPDRRV